MAFWPASPGAPEYKLIGSVGAHGSMAGAAPRVGRTPAPAPGIDPSVRSLETVASDPWAALLAAIQALGRMGSPAALLQLVDMAGEGNPALQNICSAALGTTLSRQALLDALRDADPQVSIAAAQALGRAPGSDAQAALAEAVRNGHALLRVSALQALVAGGAPDGLVLAEAAMRGANAELGRAAAEALILLDTPEARTLVLQAARSSETTVRTAVAQTLALEPRPDADMVNTLLALAVDTELAVRQPTLGALSQLGTPAAIQPVLESARVGSAEDRAFALGLLGNVSDARAAELITAGIADPSPQVATAALSAATHRLGAEADDAIASRLIDFNAPIEMKRAAAQALWQHGGPLARLYAMQITEQLGDPARQRDP